MSDGAQAAYEDGQVVCDGHELVIKRYYPWGPKHVPYASIRGVEELPLTGASKVRRWRIWGSGDFIHWWNLDSRRPSKTLALVIDVGRHIKPTITPDDPQTVERLLKDRLTS